MVHKFNPEDAGCLDSQERYQYLAPGKILGWLKLEEGEVVADVGCGTGFFSIPAAHRVGPGGRVLAIDISPVMLQKLSEKLVANDPGNIETYLSKEYRVPVEDSVANAALLANVLHEVENKNALVKEVKRILAPGGRLLVVEWKKEETPHGPPTRERIDPDELSATVRNLGLVEGGRYEAGPHHYAALFYKT